MSEAVAADAPLAVVVESRWERRARIFGPVVIAACALLAYANSFNAPFVFDGHNYLEENPQIRQLWPIGPLLEHVKSRPVGYVTFALNYVIGERWGKGGYHLPSWHATNLFIHTVGAWALFGIARRSLQTWRLQARYGVVAARLALAIAVLWVVHPLCTQSVTYLYQRLESLMGMFYLCTLYFYLRYAVGGSVAWAVASITSCLLCCLTKEVGVTAPLMVLWYDRAFLAHSWDDIFDGNKTEEQRKVHTGASHRGAVIALLWLTLLVPATLMMSLHDSKEYKNAGILDTERMPVRDYVRTQPEIVLHYLRLAVVPWGLNIDYAWQPTPFALLRHGPIFLAQAVLIGLMFVAVWKRPPLGFVGAWWFVILAPTSSIAPIIDLAFEHRTYLSLIAPVTLLVMGAYELLGLLGRRFAASAATVSAWRLALCVVVVSILTTLTLLRNYDYRSELALWRDVRFKSPENSRAHYNYGVYLQIEGTDETVPEAIREYKEALKLVPGYPGAHLNIAALAAWKGRYEEAVDEYRAELVNQPTLVQAIVGLADALVHLNRHDEARPYIEQALQLDPNHAEAKALRDQLPATVPTPT